MDHEIYEYGDLALQGGGVLRNARLAYKTAGSLNAARDNAIIYPTSFGTTHADIEWLVGPGKALDPGRYFIIMPNMLGNGLSSSPSHRPPGDFPDLSVQDSVTLQERLLRRHFGIDRLRLAVGFSMGGQQAYHWAAMFPDKVARLAVICSSARTSRHNQVFLEGVKAALCSDPAWNGRYFDGAALHGIRTMARVYAGWGLSADFYRAERYRDIGYTSLEDFIVRDWEAFFLRSDANNLLAMLGAWQRADIGLTGAHGSLQAALAAIPARALIMPSTTDMYFAQADSREEARALPHARLCPIDTIWGHRVNNPRQNPGDAAFIDGKLAELLQSEV